MTEQRPWGSYIVLENSEFYKVKKITVNTSQRLSYQSHSKRKEFWTVVRGYAKVTLEGVDKLLTVGESIEIPLGAKHRIQNASEYHELEFIEVQTGDYFGEDDIVRYSDDYGREDKG
jgi:mannose-6-phosphate isomerase-like protein (cupin superfamily)